MLVLVVLLSAMQSKTYKTLASTDPSALADRTALVVCCVMLKLPTTNLSSCASAYCI